jgi:hypothetical protein
MYKGHVTATPAYTTSYAAPDQTVGIVQSALKVVVTDILMSVVWRPAQ